MKIRPGGPGDIAAVLALGDEAVRWMNARGNTQQWGSAPAAGRALAGHTARDAAATTVTGPAGIHGIQWNDVPALRRGVVQVADAVDTCFIEQHQLPAAQRWQVRDAVRYGRELPDPALRRAAYGLAGCAMCGELSLGRGLRAAGVILVTEGTATFVLGIVLVVVAGGLAAVAAIIPFVLGAWWMVKGTAALRIAEQGPARARQLNA